MAKEILNEQIDVIENKLYKFSPALLKILIKDNATKENLKWATATYARFGEWFLPERSMNVEQLIGANILTPRVSKTAEEQQARTKDKGEVFTPAWMCNKQVNFLDEDWFGRKNVFNTEIENGWKTNKRKVTFSKKLAKTWQEYVLDKRLEITCGEAPYLVSRYDVVKGTIIPVQDRIGILDRKLRIVNENVDSEVEWYEWALKAFQSTYGYDYQGDNVLVARENLLYTFIDNMVYKFNHQPSLEQLKKVATIISWNVWQMDGLKYTVPYSDIVVEEAQISLFEWEGDPKIKEPVKAVIKNWSNNKNFKVEDLVGGNKMKFDYIIGNPPYQDMKKSDSPRDMPIYDKFMNEAYKISDRVLLITPARFLFNAGFTSKEWNNKMLNDEHFKVMFFEADSSKVFANTQISGGVAVTYRDGNCVFDKIGEFIPFEELTAIVNKCKSDHVMTELISSRDLFHYSDLFFIDFPDKYELNNKNNVVNSNAFDRFEDVFTIVPTQDDDICFLGRYQNKRAKRYIQSKYIEYNPYISQNKVIFAQTNGGAGTITKDKAAYVMGEPTVSYTSSGFTDSFVCVGVGDDTVSADNCCKYIKTKFMRALLGTLKRTGSITKDKWANVPVQNFTNESDIDWSQSIKEIDQQLYKKYGLSDEEKEFIETHVKEMN